jgi:hypothetical protein
MKMGKKDDKPMGEFAQGLVCMFVLGWTLFRWLLVPVVIGIGIVFLLH